jgi:hypothetical protein
VPGESDGAGGLGGAPGKLRNIPLSNPERRREVFGAARVLLADYSGMKDPVLAPED